jgi:predicted choloylglycine hydrolase
VERIFEAIQEDRPGPHWQSLFQRHWAAYKRWFLREGDKARPFYLSARRALKTHMPELVPTYDQLVELAGGSDLAARFLTLYCPPPYVSGCSQAVWPGNPPVLVRNYDYSPQLFEAVILKTAWNGRPVIAMSDCLWGVVDGINGDGLAVSLTFGGRRIVGKGFGMPLILRYILEFCTTTQEAMTALQRLPTHMAYNVTALDRFHICRTAYLSPDRPAVVKQTRVATNHQQTVEWHQHARATATIERERFLSLRLRENMDSPDKLIQTFLRSPLYSTAYRRGFGTLYTAVYRPDEGEVDYLWPNGRWFQSFKAFEEGVRMVRFPEVPEDLELLH